jgi:dTDP-4-amino-4,6-dideoxygalactose transaminase
LTAALLALEVRGRVAVPAFTFPASAHAITMAGCVPVLCDADRGTSELSPEAAEQAVREHGCVAIMHVRSHGLGRELSVVEGVARSCGVPLIIDGAAGYGGEDASGAPIGGAGDAEVVSFHATKVFAVGEGGAVITRRDVADRVRHVSNFSLAAHEVTGPGMNAKLSEFGAAVGLAMLELLDEHLEARRALVEHLRAVLAETGIATAPDNVGRPAWQCLPLRFANAAHRDLAQAELRARGVEARPYYAPGLHRTTAFAANAANPLPVTDELVDTTLCLPLYSEFDSAELEEYLAAVGSATIATAEGNLDGIPRH